ncbi:fibropellin-3-like [Strongylocentrotus purpuratus]|uniref:EGF-like domain-containing protein n=1 Tax=Strongylocentrotus purpuratus TaxID=7668 RepID=A0A7M7P9L8_STRPU|nr:fibropellin-3-like [Strongylocentrotus purpuratus]
MGLRRAEIQSSTSTEVIPAFSTYYFDLDNTFHTVYAVDKDSQNVIKADLSDGGVNPTVITGLTESGAYGIKYDIIYRRIFWTNGRIIWKGDTDSWIGNGGLSKEEFVDVGATADIKDLYIDHAECRIYWFTQEGVIESIQLDGTNRQVHYSNPSTNYAPRIIQKFGDIMYWIDSERRGLGAINLTTGEEVGFAGALLTNGADTYPFYLWNGFTISRTGEVNFCYLVTCQGGGTCTNQETEAVCTCPPTMTGARCEIDIDECSAETYPCDLAQGTCHNTHGSYECGCESGYYISTGTHCIEAEICDVDDACFHRGSCANDTCFCVLGFLGLNCEIIDCDTNPCKIGSTCSNNECLCPSGFKGSTCESIDCINDPCMNGAVCENNSCNCPDGYTGLTCWYKIPD